MNAHLLVRSTGEVSIDAARVGGLPAASASFAWPRCRTCAGFMQFIAQVPLASSGVTSFAGREELLLLFQCQNQPGLCDEWDPEAGGNAALVVRGELRQTKLPPGVTSLPRMDGITLQPYDDSRHELSADDGYCEALDAEPEFILGKAGGAPLWLQADETPSCRCGARMEFVFLLEAHAGGGINFGDSGVGYAFACPRCPDSARFLFQCA